MNNHGNVLLSLRRPDLDFQIRAREALVHVEDALRKKELPYAKQLLSEFVFFEKTKSGRLNTTQETQLVVVLLSEFFAQATNEKIFFFYNIFEPGKNSRKFLLLKFILTGIAIQSAPALNAAGAYLVDPTTQPWLLSSDFGRLLINEITFFANNSIDKLKSLAFLSPLFVNSLCLIFAETFKDDQLPTAIIGSLVTEFVETKPSPPFIFTFTIPAHTEIGALILGSFMRWAVLSELFEEKPSYSRLLLKILECLSSVEPVPLPVVATKYIEVIIDQIERAAKVKDPRRVQNSLGNLAQLVQVSKPFFYGNVPLLISKLERLKSLPKNPLLDLVIASLK